MHISTLRASGGSVIVTIPKALLESLGLAPDAKVGLTIERDRIVMQPQPRPKYTVAELMAKCDLSAPWSEEEKAWDATEPAGREIW
jgi:antitoxin ChpS